MAEIRGPWNLHRAIRDRWFDGGVDAAFLAASGNVTTNYPTLDDSEQRPEPPGPYCVFEVGDETPQMRSGGTSTNTFSSYESTQVTFTIYGRTKTQVVDMAKEVAQAFDPKNPLTIGGGDGCIYSRRVGSTGARTGDEEFSWILVYEYLIDATYDLPPVGG